MQIEPSRKPHPHMYAQKVGETNLCQVPEMNQVPELTPSGLSKHAARWYADCRKQFDFRTAGELETLAQAAHSLTRIEECIKALKRDGHFINGSKGLVSHPAARLEQQHRAQFLLASRQLGISSPKHHEEPDDE